MTLTNSIFWGNTATLGHEIAIEDNSSVTVSYSNVQGGQPEVFVDGTSTLNWVAGTNINADPLFVDAANNDFHLQLGSPSIDVGNASDPDLPPTDYEGDPRIIGSAPDMGVDEWKPHTVQLTVIIDIKPGNKQNVINPRAKGVIWVAVLSDTDPASPFDPSSQVDIPSVEFGPDGAKAKRHKVKDINRDGLGDLLLRFRIPETGIACGDTEATLTGETFDGQSFTGTDSIKTVGCKPKKHYKKKH
ncbi:MAG: choice-of-anchor Q domain-containing protein [Pseudomonadota bacterium]